MPRRQFLGCGNALPEGRLSAKQQIKASLGHGPARTVGTGQHSAIGVRMNNAAAQCSDHVALDMIKGVGMVLRGLFEDRHHQPEVRLL